VHALESSEPAKRLRPSGTRTRVADILSTTSPVVDVRIRMVVLAIANIGHLWRIKLIPGKREVTLCERGCRNHTCGGGLSKRRSRASQLIPQELDRKFKLRTQQRSEFGGFDVSL
jgi:hypothetical protein